MDESRGSDFSSCGDREPERVESCGASSCQSPKQVRLPAGPQRHAEHEQGAAQVPAPGLGRRDSERMDHGGDSAADHRDPATDGGDRKDQGNHGDAGVGQTAESSPTTQVGHGEVRARRPGSAPVRERDHSKDGEDGDGSHPGHLNGPRGGRRGVRETCGSDLQGVEEDMPNLCLLGGPHQRGEQGSRPSPSSLGAMVGQDTIRGSNGCQDGGRPQPQSPDEPCLDRKDSKLRQEGRSLGRLWQECKGQDCCQQSRAPMGEHDVRERKQPTATTGHGGNDQGLEGRAGRPQGGEAEEKGSRILGGPAEEVLSTGHTTQGEGQEANETGHSRNFGVISESVASRLEEESRALIPGLFQALVSHGRPVLMEVACAPDSLLSMAVQERTGVESSATRASIWNGCDLSQGSGVKLVLARLKIERPEHVWISTPCGPFSPMQNVNQRTDAQRQELQEKRRHAQKIYVGAAIVMRSCIQMGIHCSWEWAERCEAWRLPLMQRLLKQLNLHVAITKGCTVGLRDRAGVPMQKGWKVATTHERLAQVLNRPCRCPKGFRHGKCEGSETRKSERYTTAYARLVAQALTQELTATSVHRECHGESVLLNLFGEGETCTCQDDFLKPSGAKCGWCLQGQGTSEGSGFRAPQVEPHQVSQASGCIQGCHNLEEVGKVTLRPEVQKELESTSQTFMAQGDFSDRAWEDLISRIRKGEQNTIQGQENPRIGSGACCDIQGPETPPEALEGSKGKWLSFGACCGRSGPLVSDETLKYPETCRYVNMWLGKRLPKGRKWTSTKLWLENPRGLYKELGGDERYPKGVILLGNEEETGIWSETTLRGREQGINPEQSIPPV